MDVRGPGGQGDLRERPMDQFAPVAVAFSVFVSASELRGAELVHDDE
jgi:hypothetical protein